MKTLLYSLIIVFGFILPKAQNSPISTVEYQALVDFYNATNGANWNNKWDVTENNLHETSWYGVKIENGHVVELNLRSNYIRGDFPSSFSNLKSLRKLDLYGYYNYNNFSTADLNNLAGLESLEYLDMSYCSLQGQIPASLSKLKKLKTLTFYSNNLSSIAEGFGDLTALSSINLSSNKIENLPSSIGSLENLVTFEANNNKITSVPTSITGLKKLQTFQLEQNQIAGPLIKEFENLTALRYLYLNYNQIDDIKAFLPTTVSLNLYYQDIYKNTLDYKGSDVLITNIPLSTNYHRTQNNFTLKPTFRLYINGSAVGSDLILDSNGNITIPRSSLLSLKTTDKVYLYQNYIGNSVTSYSKINFKTITLNQTPVAQDEYQALVDFYNATNGANWYNQWDTSSNNIHENPWYGVSIEDGHVVGISLRNNYVRGSFPASFKNLKHLRNLDLYGYYSSNDFSTADLNNLSELTSLQSLDLTYSNIKTNIPESWGNLKALKNLYLNNNAITSLPESLGNWTELVNFNIQSNKLSAIPIGIENLKKVQNFNLENNQIKGAVIKEFEGMTALKTLSLNNNQLDDVKALLPTSVSLNLHYQEIYKQNFEYNGKDVVITDLPAITKYQRNLNNFTSLPTFRLYINNSAVGSDLSINTDGHLMIPRSSLLALKTTDKIYLYQNYIGNNVSYYSKVNYNTITINQTPVAQEEYQALVDFYNATNGANWSNKWNTATNNLHESPWYGVSIEDGHVVGLNLRNNYIRGTFPESFKNLKYLRSLDLYGYYNNNNFSTANLENLSGLENLEYMDISYSSLSGEIPESWGNLKKVKTLNLNNNGITKLPESIGNLTELVNINMSTNKISLIPTSIANLTKLQTFDFQYNQIKGALIKEFESLTTLKNLYLNNNQIDDIKAFLPTSVNLNLHSQDIYRDTFTYSGKDVVITDIPASSKYNRNLNNFTSKPTFRVYINNNAIGTELSLDADGNITIPTSYLLGLKKTDKIYLYQNYINNSNTYYSNIRYNNIVLDLKPIAQEEYQALVDFYNATNGSGWNNKWDVTTNNIHENPWYGVSIEDGHIVGLNLRSNYVRGTIPTSFSNLKHLRTLDLNGYYYSNNFSTADLNNLSGLEKLEYLDLSYNSIQTNIPDSWGNLTNLKTLLLNYNSVTGALPTTLKNLTSLKTIEFNSNRISNVDKSLGDLPLTGINFNYQTITQDEIEISSNEINIDLPLHMVMKRTNNIISFDGIYQFTLFVNGNSKTNALSTKDGKLIIPNVSNLNIKTTDKISIQVNEGLATYSTIDFGKVTFGAPISDTEFEALKKIYASTDGDNWTKKWNISTNNLHEIGWFGVGIKGGHVISLNLPSNKLNGILPNDIKDLPKLKTINFQNNNLSGTLPDGITNLSDLESLDLSINNFEGNIPSGVANLLKLKKFAIAKNLFSGTIPSFLSDFPAIEHLDISFNSFNKIEKKLYYNFTKTYIDLRNQIIQDARIINLEGNQINVELPEIVKYDLEQNNFDAKNNFAFLVNNVTHSTSTLNDLGTITFDNIKINDIPSDAKISIRQLNGSFKDTEFFFAGIKDGSSVPVAQQEYDALVELYNALDGANWTNKWDVSTNNIHQARWFGVSNYDGHITSISLPSNNLKGTLANIWAKLPYLNKLYLRDNKIDGIDGTIPTTIETSVEMQNVDLGTIELSRETLLTDNTLNRYNHATSSFSNQSYTLYIGTSTRNVTVPEGGLKLMNISTKWNEPNNQTLVLRQTSGSARLSSLTYQLTFKKGDSNIDNAVNVLDVQSTLNTILMNYQNYFNTAAADMNSDNNINIFDIIQLVNSIQKSATPNENKMRQKLASKTSELKAAVSIDNNKLILDSKTHQVASFEIILENVDATKVKEQLSQNGYTVSVKDKGSNQVSILGYSMDSTLSGISTIAEITNGNAKIVYALLSDVNAEEIPSEIIEGQLSTINVSKGNSSNIKNYPNPFVDETTIAFNNNDHSTNAILSVYNLSGAKVLEENIKGLTSGENKYLLKRKNLPSGLYIYTVKTETTLLTGKMIIK